MRESGANRGPRVTTRTSWQGLQSWRVLDTDFGDATQFLATWFDWLHDAQRPQLLHYVALCASAPSPERCIHHADHSDDLRALSHTLVDQWFGLIPGFHRFLLSEGRVILTLCVGDAMQSLRQQAFHADSIRLNFSTNAQVGAFDADSLWSIKALARCCKRGTTVQGVAKSATSLTELKAHLQACGFESTPQSAPADRAELCQIDAVFAPPWPLKSTRHPGASEALPVQRCAVIGAGLAGASVAASLARRGWQVQVLDQAPVPAAGASGLPVGLVFPHVSSDDCPLSRLSRAGVRMMLQQTAQHLEAGQQWAPSGVLERQIGGTPQLPATWPEAGMDWSTPNTVAAAGTTDLALGPSLWHPKGAWIKPAELVSAWLRQPGVTCQTNARVDSLRFEAGVWHLLDVTGAVLCKAERVVLANACGAQELLQQLVQHQPALALRLKALPASQGMRGLLSWARHAKSGAASDHFAPCPVNGSGSMISQIPTQEGLAWYCGSSYQPDSQTERADLDNHTHNLDHLSQLLPTLANALAPVFASDRLNTWKGTRCVSIDRMPLVGPLDGGHQPSLWICASLGSRGLSFSVLCAELLAARMGAEPWPVEANLAKSLEALRR